MDDHEKEKLFGAITVTEQINYLPYCDADIQEIFRGENNLVLIKLKLVQIIGNFK